MNAFAIPVGKAHVTSRNLLTNTDFGDFHVLNSGWKTFGSMERSYNMIAQEEATFANFKCNASSNCEKGESVYQDVLASSISESYFPYTKLSLQSGSLLKASQVGAEATLTLFILGKSGAVLKTFHQRVALTENLQPIRMNAPYIMTGEESTLRFQIYFHTPDVVYSMDEAFLAPLPLD